MKSFVIAKAVIVNDQKELLVLRRSKSDERRPGQLDIPGGRAEEGEDMLTAVRRETQEATGIRVEHCDLVFAMSEPTEHGSGTWLAFLARVQGQPSVSLSFEHDRYEWLPFNQAMEQLKYPRQRRMMQYVHDHQLLEND